MILISDDGMKIDGDGKQIISELAWVINAIVKNAPSRTVGEEMIELAVHLALSDETMAMLKEGMADA